jgi:hypothetical protein
MMGTYEEKLAAYEERRQKASQSWYAWARGRPLYEIRAEAERHATYQLPSNLRRAELLDLLTESEVGHEPRPPR